MADWSPAAGAHPDNPKSPKSKNAKKEATPYEAIRNSIGPAKFKRDCRDCMMRSHASNTQSKFTNRNLAIDRKSADLFVAHCRMAMVLDEIDELIKVNRLS